MNTLNISLTKTMRDFVDKQIRSGAYSTASEHVRELIRGDQTRKAQDRLEALLLAGLEGVPTEMTQEDWEGGIRQETFRKLRARNAPTAKGRGKSRGR